MLGALRWGAVAVALVAAACGDSGTGAGPGEGGDVGAETATGKDAGAGDVEGGGHDVTKVPDVGDPPDAKGDEDVPVAAGEFGAPCQGNVDCFSGWCVEGKQGFVCTKTCQESCPDGFDCKGVAAGADVVFLCLPRVLKLCAPCQQDFQCNGGACLLLDGERQCGFVCEAEEECPSGYTCGADPEGLREGSFCQPVTGSCSCTPDFDGGQRTCVVESEVGSCMGVETCDAEVGWVGCTATAATAEVCDGLDNDCNGLVDDGLPKTEACSIDNAAGSCAGVSVCAGGGGWVCDAKTPEVEVCNGVDDDCDGAVDEDFTVDGAFVLDGHCGACGYACAEKILHGAGACNGDAANPRCVVASCDEGYVPYNDFQCGLPPDVGCQPCGSDADCFGGSCVVLDGQSVCVSPCAEGDAPCPSGAICGAAPDGEQRCLPVTGSCTCNAATAGKKRSCQSDDVLGTCYGVETCDAEAGWTGCTAPAPAPEQCNGVDDDCDGLIDEELADEGAPCTNAVEGVGACAGVKTCFGPQGWKCQGPTPEPETCDFKDNDCDGEVDEDFKAGGQYAGFDHCGTCNLSCGAGFPNAAETACKVFGAQPQCAVETCEPGYTKLNEFQCIPNVATICQPCSTDENCLGEGAACVALAEGGFCGKACQTQGDCPDGYGCQDVGKASHQCVPSSGSCSCDGTNTDLARACSVTWTPPDPNQPAYTCKGSEQCTADGWGGCQLPVEACDGLDNDCDGAIDEGFKNAQGQYASVQHCGGCNISCLALQAPNTVPACKTGGAVPQCDYECVQGWYDVNGSPVDGCECKPVAGDDLAGDGVDSNCDGIDGDIAEGVFVTKNGDDAAPGTLEAPMLTVSAALARAFQTGKRDVYVATGVYSESVALQAGVGLFGGYSSDFTQRSPLLFETALIGQEPSANEPGTVTAVNLGAASAPEPTVLDGFTVFGPNAANSPGANSYAIYLRNAGSKLLVRNNRVFGNAGGNGQSGGTGGDGTDGVGGAPGLDAKDIVTRSCAASNHTSGGAGGARTCSDGVAVSGGKGGDSTCPVYNSAPGAAEAGTAGAGPGAGTGGTAGVDARIQSNSDCYLCNTPSVGSHEGVIGKSGAAGTLGAAGPGCSATAGQIVAGHWVGTAGGGGVKGGHGGGGGGGGSGGGVEVTGGQCTGIPTAPASCCSSGGAGACSDSAIRSCVCAIDSYCCNTAWDSQCVAQVDSFGCGVCAGIGGDDLGGTGGGGGSGGCAGTGGQGGQAGGGSFGVFVTWDAAPASLPVIANNTIRRGAGGSGGAGGPGGAGGVGGAGAPGGGPGDVIGNHLFCASGGQPGGNGGQGGHGGGGGGGCGGSTWGLYVWQAGGSANLGAYKTGNSFVAGAQGGAGGAGGPSLGQSGTAGATGAAADTNF